MFFRTDKTPPSGVFSWSEEEFGRAWAEQRWGNSRSVRKRCVIVVKNCERRAWIVDQAIWRAIWVAYHPPASQRRRNRSEPAGLGTISFSDKWMTTSGTQIAQLQRRLRSRLSSANT